MSLVCTLDTILLYDRSDLKAETMRKEFALEDVDVSGIPRVTDMSPSVFLQLGIEIEDQQ